MLIQHILIINNRCPDEDLLPEIEEHKKIKEYKLEIELCNVKTLKMNELVNMFVIECHMINEFKISVILGLDANQICLLFSIDVSKKERKK